MEQHPQDKCKTHNKPFYYFCETCSQNLCQDCAVFSHATTPHKIEKISNLYKSEISQVLSNYAMLGQSILSLTQLTQVFIKKQKFLQENYEKEKISLEQAIQKMQDRLDQNLEEKIKKILVRQKILLNEKLILEKILETIQSEIESSTKWQMIQKSDLLLSKIQEITSVPWENYEIPENEEFVSELVPSYQSLSFVIQDFLEQKSFVFSPVLVLNSNHWQVKVYPNGNGPSEGKFVSVFLQLVKGVSEEQYFDFSIEIINARAELNVLKECSLRFKQGECWGFSKFLMISKIKEGFLQDGSVLLKFSVRFPLYKQAIEDQVLLISQLKANNKIMKQRINK